MADSLPEGVDINEVFKLLDSSSPPLQDQVKTFILEEINSNRDSKLLELLIEHFMVSQSTRSVDILESLREPHDKVLLEHLEEWVKGPRRTPTLTLLNLLVYRTPAWMYRAVAGHRLVSTFIAILKSDSEATNLALALSSLASLLFKFPSLLTPLLVEILEAFVRVVTLSTSGIIPTSYLPDLHDALFSLFHRIYILFPCNLLAFLRSTTQVTEEFHLVLKEMFGRVRFHPLLLTATKESEVLPERWRQKETHALLLEDSDFRPLSDGNTALPAGGLLTFWAVTAGGGVEVLQEQKDSTPRGWSLPRLDSPSDFLGAHLLQASNLYISSSRSGSKEEILRGQLALSHIRMWFESHRREVQAEQNRQLLGKIKASLALEEENTALRKEFLLKESTIQDLQDQISQLQAHIFRCEKSLHSREADLLDDLRCDRRITEENTYLKGSLASLEGQLQQKEEKLVELQRQVTAAQVNWEEGRAAMEALATQSSRLQHCQEQSHRLSKELVLLAELNTSYRARLEALAPPHSFQEEVVLTSREEINGLKQNLESKCHQLEACRAKLGDVEDCLIQANKALACTKEQMEELEAAHSDHIKAKDDHLASVAHLCAEQELYILELQHQLSQSREESATTNPS